MTCQSAIVAVGHYLPQEVLPNAQFERMLDTTDDWIVARTGIEERRISVQETPADMAKKAAVDLFDRSGLPVDRVDALICTTNSSPHIFPPVSTLVAGALRLPKRTMVFDVGAGCSAFLLALNTASAFILSGQFGYVLVISAEKMSSVADYSDRRTCVLFGDGAGACLLTPSREPGVGTKNSLFYQDTQDAHALYLKNGSYRHFSRVDAIGESPPPVQHFLYQEGGIVFKMAVRYMVQAVLDLLKESQLSIEEVDWVVPHQANLRIVDAIAREISLPEEKMLVNIQRCGNTSSASIPICLSEFEERFKKGDNIILVAFGTGYIAAAVHVVWGYEKKKAHG